MGNLKEKKCSVCQVVPAATNCSTTGGIVDTCDKSSCKALAFTHGAIFVANQEKAVV